VACEVVSSGVDWLTATVHGEARRAMWGVKGPQVVSAQMAAGNRRLDIRRLGYEGQASGEVWWGERKDSAILCLSGPLAERECSYVLSSAEHISRIDLAVTARLAPPQVNLAMTGYALAQKVGRNGALPFKCGLLQSTDGGETLYIGRRQSDVYLRLYNKGIESADPAYAGCWRWEAELKGGAAESVGRECNRVADRASYVMGFVGHSFRQRGVPVPWTAADAPLVHEVGWRRSDHDRTIEWLKTSVAPALRRLQVAGLMRETALACGWPWLFAADAADSERDV